MGLGHLRAALPLAEVLHGQVVEVDRPPIAAADERRLWRAARSLYEGASRGTDLPVIGVPIRSLLDSLTSIAPLHPYRDLSAPTRQALAVDRLLRAGLGSGLAAHLRTTGRPLVATYFTPALSADRLGCSEVNCVVTDADISRAWVPLRSRETRIRYFAPSHRALRRLVAYGVPKERVHFSGFPLPGELVGGPDLFTLRRNLAARLVRLDPAGHFIASRRREIESVVGELPADQRGAPITLMFAVGGAGAQAEVARQFLPGLAPLVRSGRLRLILSAGLREDVADRIGRWLEDVGLEDHPAATILVAPDFATHYRQFNAALAATDVLWTKPSELTFYGALGLPLVLGNPLGVHESCNRRWARDRGAGLKQRDPRHASQWLPEWLEEGVLAAAAWAGHAMMPSAGTYRIAEIVSRGETGTGDGATLQVRPA